MRIVIMHVAHTDVSITGWFIFLGAIGVIGGIFS